MQCYAKKSFIHKKCIDFIKKNYTIVKTNCKFAQCLYIQSTNYQEFLVLIKSLLEHGKIDINYFILKEQKQTFVFMVMSVLSEHLTQEY